MNETAIDHASDAKPRSATSAQEPVSIDSTDAGEQALRESDEQFRAAFDQAAVGMAHVLPDGKWLRVNQRLAEITGYTREELMAQTFQGIIYSDDLDTDLTYMRRMLAGEIPTYSMQKRYVRKDRSLVWVSVTVSLVRDQQGDPEFFVSVIEDISAQKQAEQALRQQAQLLELAHDSTIVLDLDNRIRFWNRAAEEMYGWTREEAHGQIAYELLQTRFPESYLAARSTVETQGEWHGELIHTRRDGAQVIVSSRWALQRNEEQAPLAILEINRDVTAQKQAEADLRRINASLEQRAQERTAQLQEANAELEAFSYSVSHDLRAPLRAMQGFAEALREDYGNQFDDMGREFIARIAGAAARMDVLINDLLAYSRLGRAEIEARPISLEAVVRDACEQVESELQRTGANVVIETPLPYVLAHRTTLAQVITNLLTNAVKFVASGVRPEVRICASEQKERVRLWVTDNGIGIAAEHHDRIFRVFERLHGVEIYPGTGIGLAIVRKGIERMGGRTGVESEVGKGSRFWIELPKAEYRQGEVNGAAYDSTGGG